MTELQAAVPAPGEALEQAARGILERMFFMDMEESGTGAAHVGTSAEPVLASEVTFHGVHRGRLRLVVPETCARELAASFTGILDPNELNPEQTADVLRELANMVCGATLSRLAPQAVFDLDAPAIRASIPPEESGWDVVRRLVCGSDWLGLYWHWEEAT